MGRAREPTPPLATKSKTLTTAACQTATYATNTNTTASQYPEATVDEEALVEPAVFMVAYNVTPTRSGGSQARLQILSDSPFLASGSRGSQSRLLFLVTTWFLTVCLTGERGVPALVTTATNVFAHPVLAAPAKALDPLLRRNQGRGLWLVACADVVVAVAYVIVVVEPAVFEVQSSRSGGLQARLLTLDSPPPLASRSRGLQTRFLFFVLMRLRFRAP